MKVLVCGGRDFDDAIVAYAALNAIDKESTITAIVHGDCPGADKLASEWAEDNNKTIHAHPAQWKKYGRAAGPIRNQEMLNTHPDIDLIVALPGGRGTEGMIKLAEAKGIKIHRVTNKSEASMFMYCYECENISEAPKSFICPECRCDTKITTLEPAVWGWLGEDGLVLDVNGEVLGEQE
jgi:hypothetical protein